MRKRKWLALGALGTVVGMAVKLVRGRREEAAPAPYEPPAKTDTAAEESSAT